MRKIQKHTGKAFVTAASAALSILAATMILDRSETQRFQEQQQADTLNQLSTVRARLEGAINTRLLLVEALVTHASTRPELTQDEFTAIASPLLERYRGIRSTNLAKKSAISHIYPVVGNEKAVGLNLAATPTQKEAVDRTIASKKSVVAGPVKLVQGGTAFINRSPIFVKSIEGKSEYWGLASILVNPETIYEEAGLLQESSNLKYVLRGKDGLGEKGEVFFGNGAIFQEKPVFLSVTLPNGSWQLAAVPKTGWYDHSPVTIWLRGGGMAIALVGSIGVFILASEPARLQLAIDRATAALRQNEETLKQKNAEMKALNSALSESEGRLSQFLDAMPIGVFVTDSHGNPYYTNQTGQHLLGQGVVASVAEQIQIQYKIYQAGSDRIYPQESDPLLNALQGKSVRREDMEIHHPDKIIPIESAGTPIYDADGNLSYAIAAFQDITERKQAEKLREDYNRTLEEQVAERTAELSQTLTELQLTQDELVQSEKMAALGQLVAGVAHEINTPLGAIRSSVSYITDFLNENLSQFPTLFRELTPERETQFLELLQRSIANTTIVSGRERRQLRKTITSQLAAQNIEKSEGLANILLDLGVHDRLEPLFSLLRQSDSDQFLKTVRAFVRLQASTRDINIASDRAAKAVFALKTYARHDSSGETIEANILDGIDAVLTLYQSQIRQGIELTKNYEHIPPIQCYFDELNQVWTNLIHNALQAMNNKGSLTVNAIHNHENIQISIADSGTGIPPEIHSKIFQPFFTTKPPGEGSGLGLDIVRKIVAKHRGQITFESRPGQTTFTVILPIER
ncbi:MAG: CHASE domain-containing protein [Microcoleus sp. PH2017_01_SCD_O_A]|uniref:ATP-binding protein n=1 Tax=Microcoleus sp. PH2017_01_SCD_O_A TaxID=2798812 RepID=UPI001DBEF76A|nr:ATP-binding protein [Microcoleus sp. PH2017_01_SCD_O_A]MCC3424105.1 CHASE domain-containing protein [Microcoleus sp. PH2017_01_SCD_O_A]TAE71812.1 MAG: PAS domain S-box protein [Oscillatoriales cyanobacterium]TAG65723.1 MAG: PAS domain S-box protein [Oscillatoriales cyanobacterium]